jgi:hypothetical protein
MLHRAVNGEPWLTGQVHTHHARRADITGVWQRTLADHPSELRYTVPGLIRSCGERQRLVLSRVQRVLQLSGDRFQRRGLRVSAVRAEELRPVAPEFGEGVRCEL